VSLDAFAAALSTEIKIPVVNETGITGLHDIVVYFSENDDSAATPGPGSQLEMPQASEPGSEPGLFTAIQKQLGLRLQRQQVGSMILVIDSARRTPTDN